MSQVIRVGQYAKGDYVFLNKDGRVIDPNVESTILAPEDADVLMERIRQGYQYVAGGNYILRLEESTDAGVAYLEFTEMVRFDTDDDGEPVPLHTQLIRHAVYKDDDDDDGTIATKIAFIDQQAQTISWLHNPLGASVTCVNPDDSATCDEQDPYINDILYASVKRHTMNKMNTLSAVPVRYFKE